jgi:hypothetical protein
VRPPTGSSANTLRVTHSRVRKSPEHFHELPSREHDLGALLRVGRRGEHLVENRDAFRLSLRPSSGTA